MSELVLVGFKGNRYRAAQLLGELRARDEAWSANLHGAVAAYRNERGELTIDQAFESTKGEGAVVGSLLGSLIGIALATMALPLTAGASAVVVAGTYIAGAVGGSLVGGRENAVDASWWTKELGISDEFLQRIRDTIKQGDSAIFFLLRKPDPDDLAARFRPYDGVVSRTVLTPDQVRKLHFKLDEARAHDKPR